MKLCRLASLVVMGAVAALGVCGAKAAVVGTTTDYSKLTFSATIQTNRPSTYSSGIYRYTTGTMTVTSQKLLQFMAQWNGLTNWPTGAQLIYDWNSDQVCVADKTGTNILFYADGGIHTTNVTAYLNVEWYYDGGVYTGTYVDKTPGSEVYTEYYLGYFELYYDDGVSSDYVDLYGYGPETEIYSDTWTSTTGTWTETDIFRLSGAGYLNDVTAVFSGMVIGIGHGTYIE